MPALLRLLLLWLGRYLQGKPGGCLDFGEACTEPSLIDEPPRLLRGTRRSLLQA
jgi:hypothetical protein